MHPSSTGSMGCLLHAEIIVDNAKVHSITVSGANFNDLPALRRDDNKSEKRRRYMTMPVLTKTRRGKKRSESFPVPEKNRWESKCQTSSTSPPRWPQMQPRPRRCSSSDEILSIQDPTYCTFVDSLPRQPRRIPSMRTMSILDEALEVINGIDPSVL